MFKLLMQQIIANSGRPFSTKYTRNSGVQRRINVFQDRNPDIDKLTLNEDDLEFYECDFSKAGQFYDQHHRESKNIKRIVEFKRIERKYFGVRKQPNLLTWSEKEHIRYLSNLDPATWTPEKLSLSFPATVDVIKKILKSQWKPQDNKQIKKHDQKVAANWKAMESGELDLPESLKNHINSFISRKESGILNNIPVRETSLSEKLEDEPPTSSEFLDIVKSYKNRAAPDSTSTSPPHNVVQDSGSLPACETYVLEETNPMKLKHKYYTLEALRNEMSESVSTQSELTDYDQHFLRGSLPQNENIKTVCEQKFPSDLLPMSDTFGDVAKKEMKRNLQYEEEIPQKIIIPKEKQKPGSVFKVNDCFYNDEGEFLYRVPGLP